MISRRALLGSASVTLLALGAGVGMHNGLKAQPALPPASPAHRMANGVPMAAI
jgi:hypothetical protein